VAPKHSGKERPKRESRLNKSSNKRPLSFPLEGLGAVTLIFGYMVSGPHVVLSYWIYALAAAFTSFGLPFPKRYAPVLTILAFIIAVFLTGENLHSVKPAPVKEQPIVQSAAQPEKQSIFIKSATMDPLAPGKSPVAYIAFQNGRGETTFVISDVTLVLTHFVPEKYLKYRPARTLTLPFGDHQANMTAWKEDELVLSQDDINDLNADPPTAELYVFGKGEYSTDAGPRRLDFCRKYLKRAAPELSFCPDDIKIE
jgi:hypothetical protein